MTGNLGRRADRATTRSTIAPRRGLPSGRAVVGAFLVAAAAVGTFATYARATAPPSTRYVVAAADLPVGHELVPADLALVTADLPPALTAGAVPADQVDALVGLITLGPVGRDELLQRSGVVAPDAAPREHTVSIPVSAARALLGAVRRGERVDVVATTGQGASTATDYVVRGARVVRVEAAGGSQSTLVYVLAVPSEDDVRALVAAANAGDVYVTRPARDPDVVTGGSAPGTADADAEAGTGAGKPRDAAAEGGEG